MQASIANTSKMFFLRSDCYASEHREYFEDVHVKQSGVLCIHSLYYTYVMNSRRILAQPLQGFEAIGGLWKQKEALHLAVVLPLRHPALFRRLGAPPPRGVLLHGPPGTGKTACVPYLAAEAGAYLEVRPPAPRPPAAPPPSSLSPRQPQRSSLCA